MSGIFSDSGIFRSSGIFSGDGIFSRGGVFDAPSFVDPLAGIPFVLRLQTHRGDGVPLGLYQDNDALIPATADGDPVAVWRDELSGSGIIAVQSVSTKRPVLKFVGGTPVVRFDGIDDFLSASAVVPGSVQMVSRADFQPVSTNVMARWGEYDLARTEAGGGSIQLSDTGIKLITSYPAGDLMPGFQTHSAKCEVSGGNVTGSIYLEGVLKASATVSQAASIDGVVLGSTDSGGLPSVVDFSSFAITPDMTDETRAVIETYLASLQP